MSLILEGLVTTTGADGRLNVAPMGAAVDEGGDYRFPRMVLRPFQGSATLANLRRSGEAVFHVTDDVLLLARAAVGALETLPALFPAPKVIGWVLADACRWYAVRAVRLDDAYPRAEVATEVVDQGVIREFFGFNRAKHAVVEAAILATRCHRLPAGEIRAELARLAVLVEKTGGLQEKTAFALLDEYVHRAWEQTP